MNGTNATRATSATSAAEGRVFTRDAEIAFDVQGPADAPVVVLTHAILSSRAMWDGQVAPLLQRGLRVVRVDARGHGASRTQADRATMADLAEDTLAVMDALGVARAHCVGLSLGGMSGLGLGIHHAQRLASLVLCDMRADAPPAVAAPWDERIAAVQAAGSCEVLADSTLLRWFGEGFVAAQPQAVRALRALAVATQPAGFIACARAIQGLAFLDDAPRITTPTTLIVGANDGVLPEAMRQLQGFIAGSVLERIEGAGHLPNIDQRDAFNAALLRHFDRVSSPAS